MLVLSRHRGQIIDIGGGIDNGGVSIMLVEIRSGGKVRLGIDAPKHVSVHRREVQQDIDDGTPPRQAVGK